MEEEGGGQGDWNFSLDVMKRGQGERLFGRGGDAVWKKSEGILLFFKVWVLISY